MKNSLKVILGIVMIIFGSFLSFASLITMVEQFNKSRQAIVVNETAYTAGSFMGIILFGGFTFYLSFISIKYGIRFVKGTVARPETLDQDSINNQH